MSFPRFFSTNSGPNYPTPVAPSTSDYADEFGSVDPQLVAWLHGIVEDRPLFQETDQNVAFDGPFDSPSSSNSFSSSKLPTDHKTFDSAKASAQKEAAKAAHSCVKSGGANCVRAFATAVAGSATAQNQVFGFDNPAEAEAAREAEIDALARFAGAPQIPMENMAIDGFIRLVFVTTFAGEIKSFCAFIV
ncbi:hypothetical protein M3Y96_00382000 [Aphelenchoides besseyi]|nr:hypothetical protein M3Y96_00382000 [Aphelenchoides besseyi]